MMQMGFMSFVSWICVKRVFNISIVSDFARVCCEDLYKRQNFSIYSDAKGKQVMIISIKYYCLKLCLWSSWLLFLIRSPREPHDYKEKTWAYSSHKTVIPDTHIAS